MASSFAADGCPALGAVLKGWHMPSVSTTGAVDCGRHEARAGWECLHISPGLNWLPSGPGRPWSRAQADLEVQPRHLLPFEKRHLSKQNQRRWHHSCAQSCSICPEHTGQHLPAVTLIYPDWDIHVWWDGALYGGIEVQQKFQSARLCDRSLNQWWKQGRIKISLSICNTLCHIWLHESFSSTAFLWRSGASDVCEILADGLNSTHTHTKNHLNTHKRNCICAMKWAEDI